MTALLGPELVAALDFVHERWSEQMPPKTSNETAAEDALRKAVQASAKVERAMLMLSGGFRQAQALRKAGRKREANERFDELIEILEGLATPAPELSLGAIASQYFADRGDSTHG